MELHRDEKKVQHLGDKEQPDRNRKEKTSLTDVLMKTTIGACRWAVRVASTSVESVLRLVIKEHRFQQHY